MSNIAPATKAAAPSRPRPAKTPRSTAKADTERDAPSETLSWKDELALLFPPR